MLRSRIGFTPASCFFPQKCFSIALILLTPFFSTLVSAEKSSADNSSIDKPTEKIASIIIDDLGNNLKYGRDIINIPAALTISVLPKTLYSIKLARFANENNKEVMLHLPMQSIKHHQPSPGTLHLQMTQEEFKKQFDESLDSIPFVRGINNHMGSLLTSQTGHMSWLMDSLSQRGDLYFIDSRTTNKSVAGKMAVEYNIPNFSRDIFLDPDKKESTLQKQFDRFVNIINKHGYALAIAHPYPKTIKFLQQNVEKLKQQGIRLVPASYLIDSLNKKVALKHPIMKKSDAINTVIDTTIKTANYKQQ